MVQGRLSTRSPNLGSRRARVVDALADHAVPLGTVDPTAGLADLDPFREAFADERIVGLGESTHGTREFFRLKHRLVRFLVEELDFRLFAWEANVATTTALDEYVRTCTGDPAEVLANETVHWPWRSEAVLDLIEWLRAFNEGRTADDQVRFHGLDVQYPTDAAAELRSYLSAVDPDALDEVGEDLTRLVETDPVSLPREETGDLLETAGRVAATLAELFEERAAAYVDASSDDEFERARRHRWTLAKSAERADSDDTLGFRDEAMAAQVEWILDHEPADRVVLWGHNAHVRRGAVAGGNADTDASALGEHLRREYGDDYYPVALEFARGAVRVHSLWANEFEDREVTAPPAESLPDYLDDLDESPVFVDLESAAANSDVGRWLARGPGFHRVVGSHRGDSVSYADGDPADGFDAVAFVQESTPTTPTERVLPELDLGG